MTTFDPDTYQSVLDAIEKEEGRMAPKKRLAILSALDCFAEHGFDGTSTKMIAERAGIGEATIFRHFPTKRDLLLRMVSPVVGHILRPAASQQAQELLAAHGTDARAILREVMLSRLRFAFAYEPLVRIVIQEALVNADLREMMKATVGPLFEELSGVIAALGPAAQVDPDRFFRMIAAMMGGYFLHRSLLAPDRTWDDEAEVDAMLDIFFDGINGTR